MRNLFQNRSRAALKFLGNASRMHAPQRILGQIRAVCDPTVHILKSSDLEEGVSRIISSAADVGSVAIDKTIDN